MAITEKQRDEMLEAAKPLKKWLAENFHPHTTTIVHAAHIELLEGIATTGTVEYVDDGANQGKSMLLKCKAFAVDDFAALHNRPINRAAALLYWLLESFEAYRRRTRPATSSDHKGSLEASPVV